jgi:hypothetical protein
MNGWIIKVTKTAEDQTPRYFAAAESDPKRALILVNETIKASPPRDRLETVREVTSEKLSEYGVATGQIKDVTSLVAT